MAVTLTLEDEAEILDRYTGERDLFLLSQITGYSQHLIVNVLKKHGVYVERRNALDSMEIDTLNKICADYNEGLSLRQIVVKYGLSSATRIYQILDYMGVPARVSSGVLERARGYKASEIIRLYQEGVTIFGIMDQVEVTMAYIYQVLHKYHIPLRQPPPDKG
jgi:hypothetical protein